MSTVTLQTSVLHLRLTMPFERRLEAALAGLQAPLADDPRETIAYALHYIIRPALLRGEDMWDTKEALEELLEEVLTEGTVESYLEAFAEDAERCETLFAERVVVQEMGRERLDPLLKKVQAVGQAKIALQKRALELQELMKEAERLEELARQDDIKTKELIKKIE